MAMRGRVFVAAGFMARSGLSVGSLDRRGEQDTRTGVAFGMPQVARPPRVGKHARDGRRMSARAPKSPWSFVPTLYVLQAIPYFAVETAANVFLAAMGIAPGEVGRLTNDLKLPWMLKPLWSPLVDLFGSKRGWLLGSAIAAMLGMIGLAYAVDSGALIGGVTVACLVIAVAGATNDIATDGYYIHALDKPRQELFVGVRSAAFRLGRLAVVGGAVYLAGHLIMTSGLPPQRAWAIAFLVCAAGYLGLTLWHFAWLPRPATDGPARGSAGGWSALVESARSYFAKPGIASALVFVLFYRAAESLLAPMISPFLQAPRSAGGAGITVEQFGLVYGTVGVFALVAGGILGGVAVSRYGLRRVLWPMALAMHVPNLLYVWAATTQPDLPGIYAVVGVEQFGYGLGFTAYMAALLTLSRGTRHSTTHYAISTGLMALSAWIIGRFSGDLVESVGYVHFFWIVSAAGLLGLATLPFVPREDAPSGAETASAGRSGR
jgi:PAT family beta-lactamase induction signal transducer AmpG